ncbi:MAG: SAM-dependent methyltransferase [Deltaproteobacteria bacterium]|nr:SAM-dependent methyltransferase [Deltaproteobacteria bacterium]
MSDAKLYSAACERNQDPILHILQRVFPKKGRVVEIAAGTGMHSVYFSKNLPGLEWFPTDPDSEARGSIDAWRLDENIPNLHSAQSLDTCEDFSWIGKADAILCANMIHISPWASTEGLFRGASEILTHAGVLLTYGPYFFPGTPPEPSNLDFDASLRSRNPKWGIRSIEKVSEVAKKQSLVLSETVPMPANNHALIWTRI